MTFVERYGPWALVTGASAGIGREVARELARRGLNLVLVARRGDRLDALARELEAAHGVTCEPRAVDLLASDGSAAVQDALATHDVGLVVPAAGFGMSGPHLDGDLADHLRMLDLNCRVVLETVHLALPGLRRRGRGGIVLFGSVVGFAGAPWSAHYGATKGYVMQLGEALQIEEARHGIDVAVVAPGPTATEFFAQAEMTPGATDDPRTVARSLVRRLRSSGVVLPGWVAWAIRTAMSTAPRWLQVRIMGQVMASMAA